MITPATPAAAIAPSCAIKPVALLLLLPVPVLAVVVVDVALPPRVVPVLPRVVEPELVVLALALPVPVPERPSDELELPPVGPPVLPAEIGYPAAAQSFLRANVN